MFIGTTDSELYKAEINPLITDATPPTAAIIAPTTAYTVTTANQFAVNATDAGSIDKVEIYADSTLLGYVTGKTANSTGCLSIGTSTSCATATTNYPGSYVLNWNGSGLATGTYALKAIAYDIYGNSKETTAIPITVPEGLYPPDTQSPTVTITSPSSTQRIRKSVWVSANASDNDQVAYMEAELDGVTVITSSTGNLGKSVSLTRGSHTLVVTAKDRAGNTSQQELTFTSR